MVVDNIGVVQGKGPFCRRAGSRVLAKVIGGKCRFLFNSKVGLLNGCRFASGPLWRFGRLAGYSFRLQLKKDRV